MGRRTSAPEGLGRLRCARKGKGNALSGCALVGEQMGADKVIWTAERLPPRAATGKVSIKIMPIG